MLWTHLPVSQWAKWVLGCLLCALCVPVPIHLAPFMPIFRRAQSHGLQETSPPCFVFYISSSDFPSHMHTHTRTHTPYFIPPEDALPSNIHVRNYFLGKRFQKIKDFGTNQFLCLDNKETLFGNEEVWLWDNSGCCFFFWPLTSWITLVHS